MKRNGVFTKLNLHLFVLAVVVAADIFIGVRFALAWRARRAPLCRRRRGWGSWSHRCGT